MDGYHWADGWFFKRVDDQSVRIVKVTGNEVVARAEIPAHEWASVVASVSRGGETGAKYRSALALHQSVATEHPRIVCLCGSTRFYPAFQEANFRETMAGRIVLSVGFYPHAQHEAHGEDVGVTPEQKAALDELHLRKIDLADEVLVLNVGGYVGDSTRSEIEHARATGKAIRWLEPDKALA